MSALIKDSITRSILLSPSHHFYLPEYAIDEVEEHFGTIRSKSGLSIDELKLLFDILLTNLEMVPMEEILNHFDEAQKALKDIDPEDAPFLALALSIECDGIWSNDQDLKQQNLVKVWNTVELMKVAS